MQYIHTHRSTALTVPQTPQISAEVVLQSIKGQLDESDVFDVRGSPLLGARRRLMLAMLLHDRLADECDTARRNVASSAAIVSQIGLELSGIDMTRYERSCLSLSPVVVHCNHCRVG